MAKPDLSTPEGLAAALEYQTTYRRLDDMARRTVAAERAAAASPPPRLVFDGDENLQPVEWLIDSIIPAEGAGMLFGETDVGKTFTALDLCTHIASNQPWRGHAVAPGTVVFIEAEGGRAFAIRKQAAKSVLHPSCTGPLPFVTIYEPLGLGPDTDLSTVQTRATAIRTAVAQRGLPPVRFVVTDTLAQNMTGDADNNADTTAFLRAFRAFLRMLSEGPVFGLLIHHPGHKEKDRGRGAYALPADLDLILHLEGELNALTLTCDRMRDGERFAPILFALEKRGVEVYGEPLFDHQGRLESTLVVVSRGGDSTEAPRIESVETRILDHLQEHPRQSTTQISKDLAMKKATVVQKVDALKVAGRVTLISLTTPSGQTRQLYEVAPTPEFRDDL